MEKINDFHTHEWEHIGYWCGKEKGESIKGLVLKCKLCSERAFVTQAEWLKIKKNELGRILTTVMIF